MTRVQARASDSIQAIGFTILVRVLRRIAVQALG
jgi:hypothetical protein